MLLLGLRTDDAQSDKLERTLEQEGVRMLYDVQFIFPSNMTVGRVNELVDKIGIDLDGSVSTGDFWIDDKGIYIYANFDFGNTRPCAVRKWACDHGVVANTRADE